MHYIFVLIKIGLEIILLYKMVKNSIKNGGERQYFVYSLLILMLIFDCKLAITKDFSTMWMNQSVIIATLAYAVFYYSKGKSSVKSFMTHLIDSQDIGNSDILNNIDEAVAIIRKDDLSVVGYNYLFGELILENKHFINLEDIISAVKRGENSFEIKDFNNFKLFIRVRLINYGNKHVALYIKDISELAFIKKDMALQQKSCQELWEEAPYAVIIREMFGRIVYMNPKSETLLQKTAKDFEGRLFDEILENPDEKMWHREMEQELQQLTGKTISRNVIITTSNQQRRFCQVEERIVQYQRNKHIYTAIFDLTNLYYERLKSQAYAIMNRNTDSSLRANYYLIVDMIHNEVLYSELLASKIKPNMKSWDWFFEHLEEDSQRYIREFDRHPESFKPERIKLKIAQEHQFIVEDFVISDGYHVTGLVLNYVDASSINFEPEIIGKNIIGHIKEGLLIINFEGAIEYVNEAICRLLDYEKKDLLQMNIIDVTKDLTAEKVKSNWEITRTHNSYKIDRIYRDRHGSEIPVEIIGKHIEFEQTEKLLVIIRDVAEKRIYKRTFSESQIKFTQLFDAIQDGVYEIKLPSRNVNLYKQFDMEKGFVGVEIAYFQWLDKIHEDDRSIVYESIDILTSEKVNEVSFEYRYQNNSEWEWMRARGRYIEDEEGASILLINRNFSETMEIMSRLEESKYILTESERISHMAHWRFDVSRSIFAVSESFDEMFKIKDSGNEITHEQFVELVHPSDSNYFINKFTRAINEEEPLDMIFRVVRGTGIRYIQMFGKTYYSSEREPIYAIGNTVDITDKMIAARKLEESKKLLEGIIEQSPTGIIVTKRNGRIEIINEEATKLLNLREDFELTYDRISQFILERYELEGEDNLAERLREIQTGQVINLTLHAIRRKSPKWIMLYASPMHDEEGRFTGNILMLIDITERTLMQARLIEQTSKLVNAEKLAKLGHFEFYNHFEKLYLSDVIYDLLETKPPLALTSELLTSMIAPDDFERIYSIVKVIQKSPGHYTLEFKLKTFAGHIKHVQIFLVRTDFPDQIYYEGTIQDVSVVNSAIERIKQSEREKDTLISSVGDQITYYNAKKEIVTLNHTRYKHVNPEHSKIIGRPCREAFGPHENECDECIIQKTLETKRPFTREYMQDHLWFEQSTHPVMDGQEKVVGVVEIIRDITQDHFIREKQASLDKMQIYDQVSKGIALDYNNKLMGIMGYLNLINDFKTLPKTVREYVQIISRTALTLQETTEQLLMMSNSQAILTTQIDVVHSVENAIKFVNHMYSEQTEMTLEASEVHPMISGNEDMFFNMITSLLLNAIDAVEESEHPKVNVLISHVMDDNQVRIEVQDNGIGIAESIREHIFEPFFTTKTGKSKVGMGLTTVKSILKDLNGELTYESIPGRTVFVVVLTGVKQSQMDRQRGMREQEEAEKKGILIIDDEEIVRMLFANVLTEQGYDVFEAGNAYEGIELYKRHQDKIELVIMDMIMPGMGGRHAFEKLMEFDSNVNIIVTTGFSNDEDVHYVMENGAVDLFKKPVSIERIKNRVGQFFSKALEEIGTDDSKYVIDVKDALKKLEGNEKLYERICRKFYLKYHMLPEAILEELKEENWDKIRAHTHNIKGLAGNIGDKKLESICYELESAIRAGTQSEALTFEFVEALKRILHYLEESVEMIDDNEAGY